MKLNKFFGLTLIALSSSLAFADCPVLSAAQVQATIALGTISTDENYTLVDESGMTPAEIIAKEPTANPDDTYYQMTSLLYTNDKSYVIYVGNVLASRNLEARARAAKIILEDDQSFAGESMDDICMYKNVDASLSIPSYPFKSRFESVSLLAFDASDIPEGMLHTMKVVK